MTSNDVSQLPPELTRAGRLDAIWYFTLPTLEERKQIFKIHLDNTGKKVSETIINEVAEITDKYTGAEIQLVVKSALRRAYLEKVKTGTDKGITKDILLKAINDVIPIAVSSKEQILGLERWAQNRALYANGSAKELESKQKIKPISLKPLYPKQ